MMDDIQRISLSFLSFASLEVDEARVLFVKMMEDFLVRINEHKQIRPFLHTFPCDVDSFKLTISCDEKSGGIKADGHVALMYVGHNHTLLFKGYDAEKKQFYLLHKETYMEACNKVFSR